MRRAALCAAVVLTCILQGRAAVQTLDACSASAQRSDGDNDLYCIELLAAGDIDHASGTARLVPPSSPFGIAVTKAGEPQHDVVFTLRNLPAPASLGKYAVLMAWAATPQLRPVVKLGEVRDGTVRLGRVAFDRFLVLITAEVSPRRDGAERAGRAARDVGEHAHATARPRVSSRGIDRSDRSGRRTRRARGPRGSPRGAAPPAPGEWTPPPMHPEVSMPPAFMSLRPDVSSYLPVPSADAPLARPRELVRMADGETVTLTAAPVRRVLFGRTLTALGFNGQYPGPLIQVDEASTITVRFVNRTDFPTAVHWHGIRLDNRFDGVPHLTQEPVAPGESFDTACHFRDPGIYWYHPHHREDVLQDLGLYGNLMVHSRDPGYYAPANREEVLMLDDLLVADSGPVGYGHESPTHALMGRFGNVLLVNGEPRWETQVRAGEVVRFFLTNVSSTRVFNVSFEGGARDESGRLRSGALRARSLGRSRHHCPGGALRRRRALSHAAAMSAWSIACAPSTTSWRASSRRNTCSASCTSPRRRRSPIIAEALADCARMRRSPPSC